MNDRLARLWATKTRDDEWWSSFVTAPLAIALNYLVVDIRWLTPNIVTAVSFVTAVVASGFIVDGGTTSFVIAAVLIHLSHVFDCMDGQMARYRQTASASGSYFDRMTDQVQVGIWFGAAGFAAYDQTNEVLPVFLAFIGVGFYSLRGYTKYVQIHVEMSRDSGYLARIAADHDEQLASAGPQRSGLVASARWFALEQRKILEFNEGVFIFMLSLSLVLDQLVPMLWIFALSQILLGGTRAWIRGHHLRTGHDTRLAK